MSYFFYHFEHAVLWWQSDLEHQALCFDALLVIGVLAALYVWLMRLSKCCEK